ncbi:MAG: tol-pal system protein YbgF, partial [Desulfuromonadaceae bacterium]
PILIISGLLAASLSGCASPRLATDPSSLRQELEQLRQLQQQQAQQIEQDRNKLLLIETQMVEQQNLLAELRRELSTKKVTPGREIAISGRPLPPSATASGDTDAQVGSTTEIYLRAFSDYAAGRFEPAIQGFSSFLRQNAHSEYAGNAQYWLGECYYSQHQFAQAINEFQRTVERYPQGNKTPDALFKMASALHQLGQTGRAEEALQILRSHYPDSPAARKSLEKTN